MHVSLYILALCIRHRPSTAYHTQTDGATKRLNQIIEIILRTYVSYAQAPGIKDPFGVQGFAMALGRMRILIIKKKKKKTYVSPLQDDWSDHIPILELAYNSAKNVSTGFS